MVNSLKSFHTQLKLCGKPSNALEYLLSFLKDEAPSLSPTVSENEWRNLFQTLKSHWIMPLLYWKIKQVPPHLHPPQEILEKLREAFLLSCANNLQIENQLRFIVQEFKQNDISMLVLKGPGLARSVYLHPAIRPYSDLDILALPEQIKKAQQILKKLGYAQQERKFNISQKLFRDEQFTHVNKNYKTVELKWNFQYLPGANINVDINELFKRSIKIETPQFDFTTLHPTDALLYCAIHLSMWHICEMRLSWVYDVTLLCKHIQNQKDWEILLKRSVKWKVRLALEHSIKTAKLWTALELPFGLNDFATWPKPTKEEIADWAIVSSRYAKKLNYLKAYWPRTSNIFERTRYILHFILAR